MRLVLGRGSDSPLAKLARAHDRDLLDVRSMLDEELVTQAEIRDGMAKIRDRLIRYPALDAEAFERRVDSFLERSFEALSRRPAATP